LAGLLCVLLGQPATHGAIDQLLVTGDLGDAQALLSKHLDHLWLEGCVELAARTGWHGFGAPLWG